MVTDYQKKHLNKKIGVTLNPGMKKNIPGFLLQVPLHNGLIP